MSASPSTRYNVGAGAGMGGTITGPERKAPPGGRAGGDAEWRGDRLHPNDVRGVQPFVAGLHLELHELPFGERLEAVHLDSREVHEHVLATFLFNEAVALGVIEPLHLSLGHSVCLLRSRTSGAGARPGSTPLVERDRN